MTRGQRFSRVRLRRCNLATAACFDDGEVRICHSHVQKTRQVMAELQVYASVDEVSDWLNGTFQCALCSHAFPCTQLLSTVLRASAWRLWWHFKCPTLLVRWEGWPELHHGAVGCLRFGGCSRTMTAWQHSCRIWPSANVWGARRQGASGSGSGVAARWAMCFPSEQHMRDQFCKSPAL